MKTNVLANSRILKPLGQDVVNLRILEPLKYSSLPFLPQQTIGLIRDGHKFRPPGFVDQKLDIVIPLLPSQF